MCQFIRISLRVSLTRYIGDFRFELEQCIGGNIIYREVSCAVFVENERPVQCAGFVLSQLSLAPTLTSHSCAPSETTPRCSWLVVRPTRSLQGRSRRGTRPGSRWRVSSCSCMDFFEGAALRRKSIRQRQTVRVLELGTSSIRKPRSLILAPS